MKYFAVEIIDCENGYLILEGNSLSESVPFRGLRRKWVAATAHDLAELIEDLALEGIALDKKQGVG